MNLLDTDSLRQRLSFAKLCGFHRVMSASYLYESYITENQSVYFVTLAEFRLDKLTCFLDGMSGTKR